MFLVGIGVPVQPAMRVFAKQTSARYALPLMLGISASPACRVQRVQSFSVLASRRQNAVPPKSEETAGRNSSAKHDSGINESLKQAAASQTAEAADAAKSTPLESTPQSAPKSAAGEVDSAVPAHPATTTVGPAQPAKPGLWQRVKKEAKHYWEGTKLLGYEIKISSKLALKVASGRDLTRREDRQLKRTVQDMVRLVPFSVFVLVPFAELLLPVVLKLFPNLLPSTYETATEKSAKSKKLGATRSNVGEYLRSSVREARFDVPKFTSEAQKLVFYGFFKKIHDGVEPNVMEILEVARMFKDDMLLDNLSRPQLSAIANYMGIKGFGTSNILRYQIRHKMRLIRQDDRVIADEGVDSLNASELQLACQSRGFKTIGVATGKMRDDLSNWLQLRLKDRVPSTLLILSSAYTYGLRDIASTYDGLRSVLSALPSEVYHETELEIQNEKATNAQRLEVLKEQDELIREENKEELESGHVVQVKDNINVDEAEKPATEAEEKSEAEKSETEKSEAETKKTTSA